MFNFKNPFIALRPMLRIARSLEEIAKALTYFAVADARAYNRIFVAGGKRWSGKDESELMYTDTNQIEAARRRDEEFVLQHGYRALELDEERDA